MSQIECKSAFLGVFQFLYPMEVHELSESGELDSLLDEISQGFQTEVRSLSFQGLNEQDAKEIAWGNSILRLKGFQIVVESIGQEAI